MKVQGEGRGQIAGAKSRREKGSLSRRKGFLLRKGDQKGRKNHSKKKKGGSVRELTPEGKSNAWRAHQ